ncbi:DUF4349 domain-containing protein [Flavobacterium sp. GA093]|uniref:DUF4349 domain-containing protein n=1 Tax=Flavobacterium hydrocarbonoxydans TaxID=2683249 RepID=A0A6I4NLH8_9FLAO|nr:DUF4349 domain-containing protein [Flavobacterium hydrocarbonoxydans]MWB93742.1 DUF4349 domain-containing protein [Flavobacterium hydrocarbonoxydans]
MRNIIVLFLFIFTFSSCEEKIGSANYAEDKILAVNLSAPEKPLSGDGISVQQKIIKEAFIKFETSNLENTFKQIQTSITTNRGSIQNDIQEKNDQYISRKIKVRIPSQNFEAFVDSVSKGISYFDEKNISAQDVTEEYIDLTSRLNTKRKLEKRYLEILQKANKISEILEIEKQLSAIREEIEAKEGQLKYLESRVSESTITIEFYKTIAEKQGVQTSYGSKILNAIKTGFFEISSFFISLISIWPFILLFLVIAYFIRKRFKRKKT